MSSSGSSYDGFGAVLQACLIQRARSNFPPLLSSLVSESRSTGDTGAHMKNFGLCGFFHF